MKLELSLRNIGPSLRELKRGKPMKVRIEADRGLLASARGLAALRDAADLCIERGAVLELAGMTPCLMPGYARYLRGPAGPRLECPKKERCFLNKACSGIPKKYSRILEVFIPPERAMTDLERCMLAILSLKSGVTTTQVLKAAKGIKICASCTNEGEVFRAAERLIRFGLIEKEFRGGVYIWGKR